MQWRLFGAGAALCALAGGGLVSDYFGARQAQAEAFRAEQQTERGKTLDPTPSGTLRSLHNLIAHANRGGAASACSLMTTQAQADFAAVHQAPDCLAAAATLGAQVTDRTRFTTFRSDTARDEVIQGDHATMDGCAVIWSNVFDQPDPGPRLGRFSMRRVAGMGFEVSGVEPCPVDPPPTASTTPPPVTSSSSPTPPVSPSTPVITTPGLLPSYAPSLPRILAGRIAVNDPGTCGLFSDTGRAEFAAAHQAADCPTAVTALHAMVTDRELYADPQRATETPGTAGRTVVDGCRLTWSRFSGTPASPPGPQVGRLVLERPPGRAGYLIVGYKRC